MKKGKCYTKGGKVPTLPKAPGTKLPRPEMQPSSTSRKVPEVSAAPFLGPSLTSRPKPRRV